MFLSKGVVQLVLLFRQSFLARIRSKDGRVEGLREETFGKLLSASRRETTSILKTKEALRLKRSKIASRFSRTCQ